MLSSHLHLSIPRDLLFFHDFRLKRMHFHRIYWPYGTGHQLILQSPRYGTEGPGCFWVEQKCVEWRSSLSLVQLLSFLNPSPLTPSSTMLGTIFEKFNELQESVSDWGTDGSFASLKFPVPTTAIELRAASFVECELTLVLPSTFLAGIKYWNEQALSVTSEMLTRTDAGAPASVLPSSLPFREQMYVDCSLCSY